VICDAWIVGTTVKDIAIQWRLAPAGTAGAADYIEITNVKLEGGGISTPFEPMDQAENASRCLRAYWVASSGVVGYVPSGTLTSVILGGTYPVPMRATPTISLTGSAVSIVRNGLGVSAASPTLTGYGGDEYGYYIIIGGFTSGTARDGVILDNSGTTGSSGIRGAYRCDADIL
jgi:hypothetical protein